MGTLIEAYELLKQEGLKAEHLDSYLKQQTKKGGK